MQLAYRIRINVYQNLSKQFKTVCKLYCLKYHNYKNTFKQLNEF